jgi:O-antigen chain-terminating methyltransferase
MEAVARIPALLENLVGDELQRSITREYTRALQFDRHSFPAAVSLPRPCGELLPERVVELLLARLSYWPGAVVLDVGHANSMTCHRDMIRSLPAPRKITGIDRAEPVFDASLLYAESVRGDICDTGFSAEAFDLVWCISSLEHIGMDNSAYGESRLDDATAEGALAEMVRITRPGGSILVTVPYGKFENHGWFRNFDQDSLQELLEVVRPHGSVRELYFAHSRGGGWSRSDAADLRTTGYLDEGNAGAAGLAAVVIEKHPGWS